VHSTTFSYSFYTLSQATPEPITIFRLGSRRHLSSVFGADIGDVAHATWSSGTPAPRSNLARPRRIESSAAFFTLRYVDSSIERLQVNGRAVSVGDRFRPHFYYSTSSFCNPYLPLPVYVFLRRPLPRVGSRRIVLQPTVPPRRAAKVFAISNDPGTNARSVAASIFTSCSPADSQ